jgi:hypothetical protein
MKAVLTAALAACILMASVSVAVADPPRPGSSKPSSYAPGKKAKNGVYGTPIQPPIMGHRKSAHHKAGASNHKAGSKKKPGKTRARGDTSGKSASRPAK